MSTAAPKPRTVKCSCPVCGDLVLTPADFQLVVCATDPDRSFYYFTCPTCRESVVRQASERSVSGLLGMGVPSQRMPAEALEVRGVGAPLTVDDVLDEMLALADDDAVAAAFEALERFAAATTVGEGS